MRKIVTTLGALLALAIGSNGWGQSVFLKYGPVAGIQKSTGSTYQNTAAASADVIGLWGSTPSPCTASSFLRGDGNCAIPAGTGVTSVTVPAPLTATTCSGGAACAITWTTAQTANRILATPDATTGAVSLRALVAGDVPPINLGSTANGGVSSATILLGTNGGTSNGFFSVTGPTTALRTFTFPNASATVLTSNAAVTVAQGGTGLATLTANGVLLGEGTSNVTPLVLGADTVLRGTASADPVAAAVPNCGSGTTALNYSTSTHAFGCQTISAGTGTVTNVASGTGLTGGPITTTGTLSVDQTFSPTWTGTHTWNSTGAIVVTNTVAGTNYVSVTNLSTNAAAVAGVNISNSSISGTIRETSTGFTGPGGASALQLINSGANPISLATNSTERVIVAGTGGVTVNAPTSGTALAVTSVSGSLNLQLSGATTDAARIGMTDGNTGNRAYQIRVGGAATGTFDIFDATSSAIRFSISSAGAPRLPGVTSNTGVQSGYLCFSTANGDVTYDPSNTCLVSSIRYKQNVQDIDSGLTEVMKLRPVSYDLKPEFNPAHIGRQLGLIAEEVQAVEPRLVPLDADGKPRSVQYMQLTAVLVKAIQQQQQEIYILWAALVLSVGFTFYRTRRRGH